MSEPAPASQINQSFSELQKTVGGDPVPSVEKVVVGGRKGRGRKSKKAMKNCRGGKSMNCRGRKSGRGGKSKKGKKNGRGGKSKKNHHK